MVDRPPLAAVLDLRSALEQPPELTESLLKELAAHWHVSRELALQVALTHTLASVYRGQAVYLTAPEAPPPAPTLLGHKSASDDV